MKRLYLLLAILFVNLLAYSQDIKFEDEKEALGYNVNSNYPEVKPLITPDGKTLYFSRQNHPSNYKGVKDDQDIYFSKLVAGRWTNAQNIGKPLNDQYANGINSVSGDGNTVLIFNGNTFDEYVPGAELSRKTKSGWSVPQRLEIEDFHNYSDFEDYQLTSNNKYLIMAVERNDSKGDQDLYVSFHQSGNSWSKPINMGDQINTSKAEFSPFLAPDGKSLYFASEGHDGLGSSDIYYSKRLDETWTNWSKPKNLGPSINTPELDAYFTIDAKGDYAYFISMANGQRDIFRIKLHQEFKPDPVLMVFGFVRNRKSNKPVECEIIFEKLPKGKEEGIAHSDPETGRFNIILHAGNKYSYRAKAKGYMAVEEFIDLSDIHQYQELEQDLFLVPIEVGQTVKLNNVFFERGKYNLLEESFPTLDRLVSLLKDNQSIEIELGGHTDNTGRSDLNVELSLNRVEAVKNYLISKKIAANRLTTKGYGSSRPTASNASEATRKLNRRVEFTILKN